MSTFVSVGNATQPFARLLDAVAGVVAQLPQPVFVQYGAHGAFKCAACDAEAFISMAEFEQRVATAELLIMHAGAGSVIHALRSGKVPVVLPRQAALGEHVDDHQQEFSRELKRLDRLVVCDDASRLLQAVQDALRFQKARPGELPESPLICELRAVLLDHARSLQHERDHQ